mmetsp:Transcript_13225/g.37312  ORF Transcript_13225/g.37312 Transcript_13225/m.37312 type:complete len:227 (-) Transcript_13225:586-1266(-)
MMSARSSLSLSPLTVSARGRDSTESIVCGPGCLRLAMPKAPHRRGTLSPRQLLLVSAVHHGDLLYPHLAAIETLPLVLVPYYAKWPEHAGGEYSRDYNCANMLRNDSSCYSSTKQEGVNVVARVVNAPHFTMAEMEAIAPSDGYTSPLGQCCVFVSWDYPDVAAVGEFDLVQDRSHFLQLASRPQQRLPSTPVPVGFLDVSGSFRAKEHLPLARSGVIRTFLVHVN